MTARTVWGYSTDADEESWQGAYPTREAAIAAATAALVLSPGDAFFVVMGEDPDMGEHVPDFQLVLDMMRESLMTAAFPPGQDLLVDDGAASALDIALREWARQYVHAHLWVMRGEPERIVCAPAAEETPEPKHEEATSTTVNGASTEVKDLP
jgi:hypothetical protein